MNDKIFMQMLSKCGFHTHSNKDLNSILDAMWLAYDQGKSEGYEECDEEYDVIRKKS